LKRHYLPLIVLTIVVTIILHFALVKLPAIPFITRITGYIGIFLIAFTLLIGPFELIFRRRLFHSPNFRRDLGIFGGIVAIIHSVVGLFVHLHGQMWKYFVEKTATGFAFQFDNFRLANYTGLLAALMILIMLVTSNDLSVRTLHFPTWKAIQRLAYFMFPLVVVHAIFYKIMSKHLTSLYAIYLPVFVVVLLIQLTGMRVKMKKFS
jgi:sulfoxide reductase heme-binding subunit YedZ